MIITHIHATIDLSKQHGPHAMSKEFNIDNALDRIAAIDNEQIDRAFRVGILVASRLACEIQVRDIQLFGVKLSDNVEKVLADYKHKHGQWGSK